MKNYKLFIPLFLIFTLSISTARSQDFKKDSTGLPGDNFNLQGALDLFSKAATLEKYEQSLNTENNNVNNLDLNLDGQTDYIRVIDRTDGNAHAITLQAVVGDNDFQDIAVIELEKKGENDAIAQIVGDEDIYGKETYVEANADNSYINDSDNLNKKGPSPYYENNRVRIYFNVWFWPCVQYIYAPAYVVYVSPWYWHTYPLWWNPWRPWHWHTFYSHGWHYHSHYIVVSHPRVYGARNLYAPHRVVSVNVHNRNVKVVNNYRVQNNIVINKTDSRHRNQAGINTGKTAKPDVKKDVPSSRNRQSASLETRQPSSTSNTTDRSNEVSRSNKPTINSNTRTRDIGTRTDQANPTMTSPSRNNPGSYRSRKAEKTDTRDSQQPKYQNERPARQNPSLNKRQSRSHSMPSRSEVKRSSNNRSERPIHAAPRSGSTRNRG